MLVPLNDGFDVDLDGVGVGEQGSTSRQFQPRSGEDTPSRPGGLHRERKRGIEIEKPREREE